MRSIRLSTVVLSVAALACGADDSTAGNSGLPLNPGAGTGDSGALNVGNDGGTTTPYTPGTGTPTTPGGGHNDACAPKVAQVGPVQPDMMIVLDRSGSMQQGSMNCKNPGFQDILNCFLAGVDCSQPDHAKMTYCGGMVGTSGDRWSPAVAGLKSITTQFQDKVAFGLTTFPGPGQQTRNSCTAGVEDVPVQLNNAAAIAAKLNTIRPEGNTPTGPTLQAVLKAVGSKKASPDDIVPPQYVLLVTDGEPTCPGSGGNPKAETIKQLDALRAAGVKTYVIGYDASVNAALAKQLTEFAQHGGTNDFYPVQDEASLVAKFKELAGAVASCSYQLNAVPDDPTRVKVTVDGEQIFLNQGFTLDGYNVILDGAACDKLRDGKVHQLIASVECTTQVPL